MDSLREKLPQPEIIPFLSQAFPNFPEAEYPLWEDDGSFWWRRIFCDKAGWIDWNCEEMPGRDETTIIDERHDKPLCREESPGKCRHLVLTMGTNMSTKQSFKVR